MSKIKEIYPHVDKSQILQLINKLNNTGKMKPGLNPFRNNSIDVRSI